jgi:hypothetical protein
VGMGWSPGLRLAVADNLCVNYKQTV